MSHHILLTSLTGGPRVVRERRDLTADLCHASCRAAAAAADLRLVYSQQHTLVKGSSFSCQRMTR